MNSEMFQKIRKVITLELLILILWIPCVVVIFNFVEDRKIAGVVAGLGFLLIPMNNLYREKSKITNNSLIRVGVSAIFFLISAVPIFLLRIFNWEKNLEEISVFGIISGRQMHSLSTYLYLLMIVGYIFANIKDVYWVNSKK